jgi:hypothetical protein
MGTPFLFNRIKVILGESILAGITNRTEHRQTSSMNSRKLWTAGRYFGIGLMLLAFQNCSDVKLEPMAKNSSKVSSKLCLQPPELKKRFSKIVFMMDKSGSNGTTDPDKSRRTNAISNFVDLYRDDPYYKWSLMSFRETEAKSYINDGDTPVFGDATDLDAGLVQTSAEPDGGGTPYSVALNLIKTLIKEDMKRNPDEDSVYNIFYLSDGRPTDGCATADCPLILGEVASIVSLDRSSIFLNTVYYYAANIDAAAKLGLEEMAKVGGGTSVDAGNGEPIIFQPVKTGDRPEPWVMKGSKIIVYNMNAGFCRDGFVGVDSDADGICDADEIYYNTIYKDQLEELYPGKEFDPLNRNSLHEDYSDAFVWKFDLTATGGGLSACNAKRPDEDHDFLNSCEELLLKDQKNANGPDMVWDEELKADGGAASEKNFDSDGDLFLDILEFFAFRLENGISAAVDYASKDTEIRGVTLEQIMYEHRHFRNADRDDLTSVYDIETVPEGIDDTTGQQCYGFRFDRVPTYPTKAVSKEQVSGIEDLVHGNNENLFLFYFIATPEDQRHGKGILYHQIQNIYLGSSAAYGLKMSDFRTYKAPKRVIY